MGGRQPASAGMRRAITRARGARIKLSIALVKCGRCGKKYSNPVTHVCVTRMDRPQSRRKTKVKPALGLSCGKCGKPLGNPLTHVCREKTDFKRRKAASAKVKPQARTGTGHEYTACDDDDCSKFPCRVYKEGLADGEILGRQIGYAEGYAAGFPDGLASCPGPHGG